MKVTFLVLLRNRTKMMPGEMGFHSMSASWARFASMMPTLPMCLSSSPSCPECKIFSPDVRVSCPESGHRVSRRPSTVMFTVLLHLCCDLYCSWCFEHCSYIPSCDVDSRPGFEKFRRSGFPRAFTTPCHPRPGRVALPSAQDWGSGFSSVCFCSWVLFYGVR